MKSTLTAACVLGLAGLLSACGPEASESETIVWSSPALDDSGKAIVKSYVISRAELGLRRQAREMMRTGALKPEGVAAFMQAAGAGLEAAGAGYEARPRFDWMNSHWLWHLDMTEVLELMPSHVLGSGHLRRLAVLRWQPRAHQQPRLRGRGAQRVVLLQQQRPHGLLGQHVAVPPRGTTASRRFSRCETTRISS